MGAPQVIYIAMLGMALGLSLVKHGDPRTGTHHLGRDLIAYALGVGLLYWGGFFG